MNMEIIIFQLAGQKKIYNRVRREPRRKPMKDGERCARRASPVFLCGAACRDVIERKTPLIVAGSDFNSIFACMKTFWKDVER